MLLQGPTSPYQPLDVEASLRDRAITEYPLTSAVAAPDPIHYRHPTVREAFTKAAQDRFKATLGDLDPRIRAKLEQPFGKDNLRQSFRSRASLRHILLPLWKSGYLAGETPTWKSFARAYYPVATLYHLLQDYGDVDFNPLRGFPPNWDAESSINRDRVAMVSAALLHFNGSVADMVRWIGGPHVGAHRNHAAILSRLEAAALPPELISTLRRIFFDGIPAYCNADSSEENFVAYLRYGNHKTVDADPTKAYKATLKDNKRGFTLLFDHRLMLFLLHAHSTPQGMVDLDSLFKNPRPIFDSSFRPEAWCMAINDWTSKSTEPPLTFAEAEMLFMIWLYNLRVTYPDLEIYLADDDISGAFRWLKYNPNLMALHACIMCGYGLINTGGTFGDNTTPSNFDPIALARRLLAQFIWTSDFPAQQAARKFIPPINLADPPSPVEVSHFCPADRDSLNPGVLNPDGSRKPPPYNMHVDDNLYADVGEFMERTVSSSMAALFDVLGTPDNPDVPPALSYDKLENSYNHLRKMVGRKFDSRALTVGMLSHKREQLITILEAWIPKSNYVIQEAASLLGLLDNHTKYCPWARCWYFAIQNSVRLALLQRFEILARRPNFQATKEASLRRILPPSLAKRLDPLLARERARVIWSTNQSFKVTEDDRASLQVLLSYLRDTTEPWATPLGMIVPRIPTIFSQGDASHAGGGAHCPTLEFWFDVAWSPTVVQGLTRLKSKNPGYVHINAMEYVVLILQHAAVVARLEQATDSQLQRWFPGGKPDIPYWLADIDNMVSKCWDHDMSARGKAGQSLLGVSSELKRQFRLRAESQHLEGKRNVVADDISRVDFSLPVSTRFPQLFAKHPSLATWDYFLPSQPLLQLLYSRLFSGPKTEPCVLPTVLGRFLPASSTISSSPQI